MPVTVRPRASLDAVLREAAVVPIVVEIIRTSDAFVDCTVAVIVELVAALRATGPALRTFIVTIVRGDRVTRGECAGLNRHARVPSTVSVGVSVVCRRHPVVRDTVAVVVAAVTDLIDGANLAHACDLRVDAPFDARSALPCVVAATRAAAWVSVVRDAVTVVVATVADLLRAIEGALACAPPTVRVAAFDARDAVAFVRSADAGRARDARAALVDLVVAVVVESVA